MTDHRAHAAVRRDDDASRGRMRTPLRKSAQLAKLLIYNNENRSAGRVSELEAEGIARIVWAEVLRQGLADEVVAVIEGMNPIRPDTRTAQP